MKKYILVLFTILSFANLSAQEVNLRTMTKEERIRYVSQEATKALDKHLHDFLKELYGLDTPEPQYYALSMSYKEHQVIDDEIAANMDYLYGDVLTDYTIRKNDYTYTISFVSNPRLWKPLLYKVKVLNNGKALDITLLDIGYSKDIYNNSY